MASFAAKVLKVMEMLGWELVAATALALELAVRLGLPVIVLFVMGFVAYQQEHRLPLRGPGRRPGGADSRAEQVETVPAPAARETDGAEWRLLACEGTGAAGVECWQRAKGPRDVLRAECSQCGRFLNTTLTGNP